MDSCQHRADPPVSAPSKSNSMDEALDWFARTQADDLSERDHAAFQQWRARPDNAKAYDRVQMLWRSPALAEAVERQRPASMSALPKSSTAASGYRIRRPRFIATAMAVAAAVALVVAADWIERTADGFFADHRTATGERTEVALADGSVMVLNSGTAVDLDFTADHRGVRLLSGEAYFEVVTDTQRPFEVRSDEAVVRVVGTGFAVQETEHDTLVTVRHGKVAVEGTAMPIQTAALGAGDRITAAQGRLSDVSRIDPDKALAWLDGRLIFHNRPLSEVVQEVRRYFPGWILVSDSRLNTLEVSGNYRLDNPAGIIAALAQASGAELFEASDYLLVLH